MKSQLFLVLIISLSTYKPSAQPISRREANHVKLHHGIAATDAPFQHVVAQKIESRSVSAGPVKKVIEKVSSEVEKAITKEDKANAATNGKKGNSFGDQTRGSKTMPVREITADAIPLYAEFHKAVYALVDNKGRFMDEMGRLPWSREYLDHWKKNWQQQEDDLFHSLHPGSTSKKERQEFKATLQKNGVDIVELTEAMRKEADTLIPGLTPESWTRATRNVWNKFKPKYEMAFDNFSEFLPKAWGDAIKPDIAMAPKPAKKASVQEEAAAEKSSKKATKAESEAEKDESASSKPDGDCDTIF